MSNSIQIVLVQLLFLGTSTRLLAIRSISKVSAIFETRKAQLRETKRSNLCRFRSFNLQIWCSTEAQSCINQIAPHSLQMIPPRRRRAAVFSFFLLTSIGLVSFPFLKPSKGKGSLVLFCFFYWTGMQSNSSHIIFLEEPLATLSSNRDETSQKLPTHGSRFLKLTAGKLLSFFELHPSLHHGSALLFFHLWVPCFFGPPLEENFHCSDLRFPNSEYHFLYSKSVRPFFIGTLTSSYKSIEEF